MAKINNNRFEKAGRGKMWWVRKKVYFNGSFSDSWRRVIF